MPGVAALAAPTGRTAALLLRAGALLLCAGGSAAQLNVPDAPTLVALDVLSGSDVRVSFEAPLTDGGAAVQAYSVEWDTDPGVQEIQTITTSTYTDANEIQIITTTALDQDEVQLVTTNATALYEVQTVETDCASGGALGGTFVVGLDTSRSGGSAEVSGEVSYSADAEGGYLSLKRILEAMKNVGAGGVVAVERTATDASKGSYVWTVTFATALGNLPQLTLADSSLTGTGATVLTATVRDQNLLSGYFRLGFGGYTTASLPHDATGGEVASALEALSTIDSVDVFRTGPTDQGGYNWTVTFASDYNGGNVPELAAVSSDLGGAGAAAQVTTLRDGNELSGSFNVSFSDPVGTGYPPLATVPFGASPSELKAALEAVGTGEVSVHRAGPNFELGYAWTVSFLEREGDLPLVGVAFGGSANGTTVSDPTGVLQGVDALARVVETRKGTVKAVQTISTFGGRDGGVNASTKFFLKFRGAATGVIEANVNGTCDATAREVQTITTSTVDTFGAGGDDHVSSLLYFSLVFYTQDGAAEETAAVFANPKGGDCSVGAAAIETVLLQLDALEEVSVGYSAPVDDESCAWKVTFNDQSGNLDQMAVKVQGGANVGASSSGFWGDDVISVATERDGTVDAIKYELEKLATVGTVTVTPANATASGGCTWRVTFETNTGTALDGGALTSLTVAALQGNGSHGNFEPTVRAWPDATDVISICNRTAACVAGSSVQLGGQWAAQFRGHRTLYVDHDVSARGLKEALEATPTVGRVDVARAGPDENGGFTWAVTFLTELGDLPPLRVDAAALSGTAPYGQVAERDAGVFPPFDSLDPVNGLPLGSTTLTTLDDLAATVSALEQGIPYYFRVSAMNANGQGPAALASPAFAVPLPQAATAPSSVRLAVVDGGSLAVAMAPPLRDGGEEIDRYRVQYAQRAFAQEVQAVRLACSAAPEVQVLTTDAQDVDEVQLVHAVLEDGYDGLEQLEVQTVRCDATSGSFTLSLFGETTADIDVGDSDADIQARLQELTRLNSVNVSFPAGSGNAACADCADANCGGYSGFNVTFYAVEGASGNLPPLAANVAGLTGNRRVDVSEAVRGAAGLSGSFRLSFRGFTTVDVGYNASALELQQALQQLDPIPYSRGVTVRRVPGLPYEAMWAVTFSAAEVGGNVERLNCFGYDDRLQGNGARVVVHADGAEGPYARRYTNASVSGNELGGSFTLSLLGHATDAIDFNAADTQLKARLEALPNVGTVHVTRSSPTPEKGYAWTVTFVSNPGAFPVAAAHVEPLAFDLSGLSGANRSANVTEHRAGYAPLGGTFQLRYTNGSAYRTTSSLAHNSDASEVAAALEALDDMVGRVAVQRTTNADGYAWSVTFGPCATDPVTGGDVCNEGDLYPLELVSNASLRGCDKVAVSVAEVVAGSGPALCPQRDSGYCFDDVTDLSGGAPYTYEIAQLDVGVPYFVRVAAHTDESFGTYAASSPEFAVPSHLQPGPPPRVRLTSSTDTTVSLEWDPPAEHGGAPVTGYELWMDNWEGGNLVKVYDGTADAHATSFTVTSANAPHLESGRKYQFTARALNLCRATDLDLACYGDFSTPAVFTVRAPRPPLAPPQLTRDSFGTSTGHRGVWGDGSVTVNWVRPVDNGGSLITSYRLFMEAPDGNVTQVVISPAASALAVVQNGTLAYAPVGEQRTYRHTFRSLDEGEVYVFQAAAVNAKGRSGLSAPVAIVCATRPGGALFSAAASTNNHTANETSTYGLVRPTVVDVTATSIALKWDEPADRGTTPITGYEVWMYPGAALNTQADPDPVKQEVQVVTSVVATPAAEVQVLTVTDARDGGQFRLRVRAESRVGGAVDNTTALLTLGRCNGACVAAALSAASPRLGNVSVTGPVVTNSSHAYTVAFNEYSGPLRSLAVVNHDLEDRATDATWYTSVVRKVKGTEPLRGSFTVSFRGHETPALPYDATAHALQNELNNLGALDTVAVTRAEAYNDGYGGGRGEDGDLKAHFGAYAWTVTFVNAMGDVPLLYASPGRLTCSSDATAAGETQACAGIATTTPQPGSDAVLVYDGRFAPAVRAFVADGLTTDALYSFKVVPINAVGRGLPSAATATVSARVGASPGQTTVRGGAVSVGMAGVVHETQVVTAYDTDGHFSLTLGSWYGESLPIWANVATNGWDASSTRNLQLQPNDDGVVASAAALELALTAPGTGVFKVHVTRSAAAEWSGHSGVSWTVTFLAPLGNVPTLRVNSTNVTTGFVTVAELLSGASNEFTVEPKKASGAPVKDVTSRSNFGAADPVDFGGGDLFFTELWSSGTDVVDGTHGWAADGGVASYSPVLYEIQRLYFPAGTTGGFRLKFDQSAAFPGKVNQVCGYVSGDFGAGMRGEVDLLASVDEQAGSAPSGYDGKTWLGGGNEGAFGYECAGGARAGGGGWGAPRLGGEAFTTTNITVNAPALAVKNALEALPNVEAVDVSYAVHPSDGSMTYLVTFTHDLGDLPLLQYVSPSGTATTTGEGLSTYLNVSEVQEGHAEVQTITTDADVGFVREVQTLTSGVPCCVGSAKGYFNVTLPGADRWVRIGFDAPAEARHSGGNGTSVQEKLQSLSNVGRVGVSRQRVKAYANDTSSDHWQWSVTFYDPVGDVPDLVAATAGLANRATGKANGYVDVNEATKGASPLGGTFVLSFGDDFTDDLDFDASNETVKAALEALPSIDQVNVRREDLGTGHRWEVTFTKALGNLPELVAHMHRYEEQHVRTLGGDPTPLGGSVSLRYGGASTQSLPHDASAAAVKAALEALPTLDYVDVARDVYNFGQYRWRVTFRSEVGDLPMLVVDTRLLTGSDARASVTEHVAGDGASLTGSTPFVRVAEKEAGLPAYTARYTPDATGSYTLAVRQLTRGGLAAAYFDNQWLLGEPAAARVDPSLQFDWGTGALTRYGRDYVSARWAGKLVAPTTERYALYLFADDGARLWLDHEMLIDAWDGRVAGRDSKAFANLTAGQFHDLRVEYKEETGRAGILLEWASMAQFRAPVPPSAFYYATHVSGSPFAVTVLPGASDYPFTSAEGAGLSAAVAGEPAYFTIQARDENGNARASDEAAEDGDFLNISLYRHNRALGQGSYADASGLSGDHYNGDLTGFYGSIDTAPSTLGKPEYLGGGQYRVRYTVLKSGYWKLHVQTGGTDIECGRGSAAACSPFTLFVDPGPTVAATSEAEGALSPVMDALVEAAAGDMHYFSVQAKDAYGNNRLVGGDPLQVKLNYLQGGDANADANANIAYRGHVVDHANGTYLVTYTVPRAGTFGVDLTLVGQRLSSCTPPVPRPAFRTRQYDGLRVYRAPGTCSAELAPTLTVVHGPLQASATTAVQGAREGLAKAVVGVKNTFTLESRDEFGNLRRGDGTSHFLGYGDGSRDPYVIDFAGPQGYTYRTSSAVMTLACNDSSAAGLFRLTWDGATSLDLPLEASASAIEAAVRTMHPGDPHFVRVSRFDTGSPASDSRDSPANHTFAWAVTFLSHLDKWAEAPLAVVQPSASNRTDAAGTSGNAPDLAAFGSLTASVDARGGLYPCGYTLWYAGSYFMSVRHFGGDEVEGSPFTLEVDDGATDAATSFAAGHGLVGGVAGEQLVFTVTARDVRQIEKQAVFTNATVVPVVPERQQVTISASASSSVVLSFRGESTSTLAVGSTWAAVEAALEALATVDDVELLSTTTAALAAASEFEVLFVGTRVRGDVPLVGGSGVASASESRKGDAPFVREVQTLTCTSAAGATAAELGTFELRGPASGGSGGFRGLKATAAGGFAPPYLAVNASLSLGELATLLSDALGAGDVAVTSANAAATQATRVCTSSGDKLFLAFEGARGDVPSLQVNATSVAVSLEVGGAGGSVDGVHPLWGDFTLAFKGATTRPLPFDASAAEVEGALERLPTIGGVSVELVRAGRALDSRGADFYPSAPAGLFDYWLVAFDGACENGTAAASAYPDWSGCPAHVGDEPLLRANGTGLKYARSPHVLQAPPVVSVAETAPGSAGNPRNYGRDGQNAQAESADFTQLQVQLVHQTAQATPAGGEYLAGASRSGLRVGVANHETQALECASANLAGTFDLYFLGDTLTVRANATLAEFQQQLHEQVGALGRAAGHFRYPPRGDASLATTNASSAAVIVSFAAAHGNQSSTTAQTTVCAHRNPTPVLLEFVGLSATQVNPGVSGTDSSLNYGTLPEVNVTAAHHAVVKTYEVVKGLDFVKYLGRGAYQVGYTPTVKGHYELTVALGAHELGTDLSNGVFVAPSVARAAQIEHGCNSVAVEGVPQAFTVQARDAFDNALDGPSRGALSVTFDGFATRRTSGFATAGEPGYGYLGAVSASPLEDPNWGADGFAALVEAPNLSSAATPNTDGVSRVAWLPRVAGTYTFSANYTDRGGLLATYYRHPDFSSALLSNAAPQTYPYHAPPHCPPSQLQPGQREDGPAAGFCDSTQLDAALRFDWGEGPPAALDVLDHAASGRGHADGRDGFYTHPAGANFPTDYWAARWEGFLAPAALSAAASLPGGVVTLVLDADDDATAQVYVGGELVVARSPNQDRSGASEGNWTVPLGDVHGGGGLRSVPGARVVHGVVVVPFVVTYAEGRLDARLHLQWRSPGSGAGAAAVPADALYFTRHVEDSPYTFLVYPGEVDARASSGHGGGLAECTAMETCGFTVQARDSSANQRFNRGDDAWLATLTGVGGWAAEGRVNDEVYRYTDAKQYRAAERRVRGVRTAARAYFPDVAPLDWVPLGTCTATQGLKYLNVSDAPNVTALVARGATVVVGNETFVVDQNPAAAFDATVLPLADPFRQPSGTYALWLGGAATGTYRVEYRPQVRGDYRLDVQLPAVAAVQVVETFVDPGAALGGNFTLVCSALDALSGLPRRLETAPLAYNATAQEVQVALAALENVDLVNVTQETCGNPAQTCKWAITFNRVRFEPAPARLGGPNLTPEQYDRGDAFFPTLVPDVRELFGNNASVAVTQVTQGRPPRHIHGSPFFVTVAPNATHAPTSTAFGRGLHLGTAGDASRFTVQAKDAFGNDRADGQTIDHWLVVPFVAHASYDDFEAQAPPTFEASYAGGGRYGVAFTPVRSGEYTVAVLHAELREQQRVTTRFPSASPSRREGTWSLVLRQVGGGVASGSGAADSRHVAETARVETSQLAWDASAAAVQQALRALGAVGLNATVVRSDLAHSEAYAYDYPSRHVEYDAFGATSHFGFTYDLFFPDYVGDLPLLEPNFANTLVGGWVNATTVVDGTCAHVKTGAAPLLLETQVVRVSGDAPFAGTFVLAFRGHATAPLAWNAAPAAVQAALEALLPIGSVAVSRNATRGGGEGFEFSVTFLPTAKCDRRHALTYGDLPPLVVTATFTDASSSGASANASAAVYSGGNPSPDGAATQGGSSPFSRRAKVASAAVSAAHTTASDSPGVHGRQGLRSGTYNATSAFVVESRDRFSNRVLVGPLAEVQVVTTACAPPCNLAGAFTLSYQGHSVELEAGVGIAELESSLEALSTVGALTVTTYGVHDPIGRGGARGACVFTDPDLVPHADLSAHLAVGDWVRVGRPDGFVYSVVGVQATPPYTLRLNKPYEGLSDANATLWRQGTKGGVHGYQYVVTFDSNTQGDLPALVVNGSALVAGAGGNRTSAEVTACDWLRRQTVATSAASPINGTFYLTYGDERTRDLPFNANASEVASELNALDNIYSCTVEPAVVGGAFGARAWAVHLHSVAGDTEVEELYAEGHLLQGAHVAIDVAHDCPTNGRGTFPDQCNTTALDSEGEAGSSFHVHGCSVQTVAGRRGAEYLVELSGAAKVRGKATHLGAGLYQGEFETPRVGSYELTVAEAQCCGLSAELFNNRWLLGDPVSARVDPTVDFTWAVGDAVSPTGRDYVSVRWAGYLQPSFAETFEFVLEINDGARLFLDDALLLDAFEAQVDDPAIDHADGAPVAFTTYTVQTHEALAADRLYALRLEFRESTGGAVARLLWRSASQPLEVVPAHRLFYATAALPLSPWEVRPLPVEPLAVVGVSLAVAAWDQLEVAWQAPWDDGGAEVDGYKVEWWVPSQYGTKDVQTLKLASAVDAGSWYLRSPAGAAHHASLAWNVTSADLERALEAFADVGDVTVTFAADAAAQTRNYRVVFETNLGNVTAVGVDGGNLYATGGGSAVGAFALVVCAHGQVSGRCNATDSVAGNATLRGMATDVNLDVAHDANTGYTYVVPNLDQVSSNPEGFSVRVSARTAAGYGLASAPHTLKPMHQPDPPGSASARRVPGRDDQLRVHWTEVSTDPSHATGLKYGDRASPVDAYLVEWDSSPRFDSNAQRLGGRATAHQPNPLLSAALGSSLRAPGFYASPRVANATAAEWFLFDVPGLTPGLPYYTRVSARNAVGLGAARACDGDSALAPRTAPVALEYGAGVSLSTVPATRGPGVTVKESTQSLLVQFKAPLHDRGAAVLDYLVEWWRADDDQGRQEVQVVRCAADGGAGGLRGTFQLSYAGYATDTLAWDASEESVELALEGLLPLRSVQVTRAAAVQGNASLGYEWAVTFLTEEPYVDNYRLSVDGGGLEARGAGSSSSSGATAAVGVALAAGTPGWHGRNAFDVTQRSDEVVVSGGGAEHRLLVGDWLRLDNTHYHLVVGKDAANTTFALEAAYAGATAANVGSCDFGTTVPGRRLRAQASAVVPAFDARRVGKASYTITHLFVNVAYRVRVSARNARGLSAPQASTPASAAPPPQKPDRPTGARLLSDSDRSLQVLYHSPDDDGGAAVTKYKVEWDPSPLFNSGAGGSVLGSHHHVLAAPGADACGLTPCEYVVSGLTQGTFYHVRVFAYNKFGFSAEPTLTVPPLERPCTFAPPPASVTVAPLHSGGASSASSLVVAFAPAPDDGGCPVTQYKVEWDPAGAAGFAAGAAPAASLLYGAREVQVLTVAARKNDLAGHFRVSLDGSYFATEPIAAGCSAAALEGALRALASVGGGVRVSRRELTTPEAGTGAATAAANSGDAGYGFAYTVTFVGHGGGRRWVGDVASLRVSTNASDYPNEFGAAGSGGTLQGTSPAVAVATAVDGSRGFEQQQLRLWASAGSLRGTWRLGWQGAASPPLAWNCSAAQVADALRGCGSGPVRVARALDHNALGPPREVRVAAHARSHVSDGVGAWDGDDVGVRWVVVFEGALRSGSLPLVEVDGGGLRSTNYSAAVYANASTLVVSDTPTLDSRLKGTAVLGVAVGPHHGAAVAAAVDPANGPTEFGGDNAAADALASTQGDHGGGGGGAVTELARWDSQGGAGGVGAYVATLPGLVSGEAYHVRVSAYNGFGHAYGAATYATPTPQLGLEPYGVR